MGSLLFALISDFRYRKINYIRKSLERFRIDLNAFISGNMKKDMRKKKKMVRQKNNFKKVFDKVI